MSTSEIVRVGVVGMGIGRANGRALHRHPRAEVVALCDLVEEKMVAFALELGNRPRLYTDYRQLCADPDVDAVFVGTPNQWHVPVALEAVQNGKHVLVTKPLADSVEAAATLVRAAEEAGVVNMMSLSTRFSRTVQYLGKLARDGYFGELYYSRARSIRRNGIPAWNLGFIREGGGAFRDMGVHVLDAAWWMIGMPRAESVLAVAGAKFGPRGKGYWNGQPQPPEVVAQFAADDYAGGVIRFENGVGMIVESFWASHQPGELQIELFGTEAGARLHPPQLFRADGPVEQNIDLRLPEFLPDGFDRIADEFVRAILDGEPCSAPLRHGLLVQQMMEALLESGRKGDAVRLENWELPQ